MATTSRPEVLDFAERPERMVLPPRPVSTAPHPLFVPNVHSRSSRSALSRQWIINGVLTLVTGTLLVLVLYHVVHCNGVH